MTRLNLFRNPLERWFNKSGRETVPVKALGEHDRRRMLRHFLSLERPDRILRFGSFMGDEQITKYVNGIDFGRDMVFGVYNRAFRLAAVGHLAFSPRQPSSDGVTEKDRVAEFGVSVLKSARGMGIGSKLFERAAIVCRNQDVDTLPVVEPDDDAHREKGGDGDPPRLRRGGRLPQTRPRQPRQRAAGSDAGATGNDRLRPQGQRAPRHQAAGQIPAQTQSMMCQSPT